MKRVRAGFLASLILITASCSATMEKETYSSTSGATFFSWLSMMWKEGSYPAVDPQEIASVVAETDLNMINSPSEHARATWIGHATVLVQHQGINYLTDPHLTQRPAPIDLFVAERFIPPAITFEDMPKIDFIVISHNHYDHLDHRTVDLFGSSVTWYVPKGLKSWFLDRDIESSKVIELDWWQSHQFNERVNVTFTPSVHWSKRTPWDTNQSRWGSWAVKIGEFNSWFAGDTAYDESLFKEIGQRAGPFQLAYIPIGAYAPRYFMSRQHINPSEAIKIHRDIRSQRSMPIHWATFQLTHEPYMEPSNLLVQGMVDAGLPLTEFEPVKIGGTLAAPDASN